MQVCWMRWNRSREWEKFRDGTFGQEREMNEFDNKALIWRILEMSTLLRALHFLYNCPARVHIYHEAKGRLQEEKKHFAFIIT